jgi:hypothetical protein
MGTEKCETCDFNEEICRKLGQYEDTGLTPEQIREMGRLYEEKCEELSRTWIPTNKRLPNQKDFIKGYIRNQHAAGFIVMIEGANMPTCLYYAGGSWFDEDRNYYKVTAWMPLPEPYKE